VPWKEALLVVDNFFSDGAPVFALLFRLCNLALRVVISRTQLLFRVALAVLRLNRKAILTEENPG
jgi:hypothetical protein